ncbi:MAG: lignostilbene alpha-beta-dioxygenase [Gammaproteobacteria bacterium]|nr:lignostilbene alpha-beta-dioxygenase [Gammaproteobacteria bacterium]|tara:strand:+ start:2044 stop:3492 length:1449 start_codon:yes stop_codon:yes gene_type:complete
MNMPAKGANEAPSCHGGLANLDEEYDYWVEDIEGSIPADLTGTFLRNGPGRQKIGGAPYGHWFDGDGMLSQFTFTDGKAHFKNRYVRTPKYVEETAAQKILYRGFGTQIPGGLLKNVFRFPANPANTSLIYHGGKLLALNEGGLPWELATGSLETVGECDYDGALAGKTFSAHGKVHPKTGDYFNFGAGMSGGRLKPQACLNLYRINPAGEMTGTGQIPLATFPFCHDFALSDRYAIYFINSIVVSGMGGFILGTRTISDGIHFDNAIPMRMLVVDLDTLEVVREFETDPGAIIHFGNAFEEGDEIVIDAMFQDNFEANETLTDVFNPNGRFGGGHYHRYRLNMSDGSITCSKVSEHESEFPVFNPAKAGQRHGVSWTACSIDNGANSFFNGISRVSYDGDVQLLTLPAGYYGSEPMFAPAQGATREDDGYVLEVVYDGYNHVSEVVVLRAEDLEDQVCTLKLKHHLPHQFHGQFLSQTFPL